jgi:hypothetical protein
VTSLIHLIDPNTCQGNNVFWLVKCNRGVETRLWRILNHISSFYMLCFSAFSHKICAGALKLTPFIPFCDLLHFIGLNLTQVVLNLMRKSIFVIHNCLSCSIAGSIARSVYWKNLFWF